ncbi:Lupus La protein [Heterocephalus glaber]|uniref:Lupus La protein n=1 Tax=Heterocephalus glaber TaxID=10181 RepID=G5B240_HETGA|nr:Lupus La protein [Heterocephalus glaber]
MTPLKADLCGFQEVADLKGKEKEIKLLSLGSAKGKVQFQGKKTKFDSDEEHDENGTAGPVKRAREETDKEEPASKQQKTGNGAGDQ